MRGVTVIIAVDFDGVIAKYDRFRGHDHYGKPIEGVRKVLVELHQQHKVVVNSCRSDIHQIENYMYSHGLPFSHINFSPRNSLQELSPAKAAADIYVDDKAICFKGDWPQTLREIEKFEPWYK